MGRLITPVLAATVTLLLSKRRQNLVVHKPEKGEAALEAKAKLSVKYVELILSRQKLINSFPQ